MIQPKVIDRYIVLVPGSARGSRAAIARSSKPSRTSSRRSPRRHLRHAGPMRQHVADRRALLAVTPYSGQYRATGAS